MSKVTTPEKQALIRAAQVLGGQAAVAYACGYTDRRWVSRWFSADNGKAPAEKCPAIERATRAKGSAVTCEELRPDVAWEVLREQAGA